jgi:WD40 repeat protein
MTGMSPLSRGPVRLHRRWKADLGEHVIALEWARSGQSLAAAAVAGPVAVFDPASGSPAVRLAGHPAGTMSLSWRHDGAMLATGGQDGQVRFWNVAAGQELAAADAGAAWVEHVLWHPRRDVLVSAAGKKMRRGPLVANCCASTPTTRARSPTSPGGPAPRS